MAVSTSPAILVTGASGGIGEALAFEFARESPTLVLVARSSGALDKVAIEAKKRGAPRVETITLDLARREAVEDLEAALAALGLHVEVLVNNAGYGIKGKFAELKETEELGMIELNVLALTALCRRFSPGMIARGKGGILNIASTAAFTPGPHMAVYYATKAYVRSFSEALAYELRGTGVTVTAVCPGLTITGFQARAKLEGSALMRMSPTMSAEAVARIGYRAFRAGKTLVVTGIANKVMVASMKFAPRPMLMGIIARLQA